MFNRRAGSGSTHDARAFSRLEDDAIAPLSISDLGRSAGNTPALHGPAPPAAAPARESAVEVVNLVVPDDLRPGDLLEAVLPDGQKVQVRVPPGTHSGSTVQIQVPRRAPARPPLLDVVVPDTYEAGQRLAVLSPSGEQLTVEAPREARSGSVLRVELPPSYAPPLPQQRLRFTVPEGHTMGTPVMLRGPDGGQFSVHLPANARPGAQIEVEVGTGALANAEAVR